MKHALVVLVALCAALPASVLADGGSPPARPFPHHTQYTPNTLLPNHRSQAQLDGDVVAFYEHWKTSYLREAGTGPDGKKRYRVTFGKTKPGRTVSEGQGYGMVIVALMAGHDPDAQTIFDGLHAFALAHPSPVEPRLMNWETPDKPSDSAFDGDADIAYGLLLADAQWGTARPDYAAAARTRLAGMLASTIGPHTHLPLLGDWVRPGDKKYSEATPRSSDFMCGHFRAFARFTGDDTWSAAAMACERVTASIQTGPAAKTGLLPDFIVSADTAAAPAKAGFLEGKSDGAVWL